MSPVGQLKNPQVKRKSIQKQGKIFFFNIKKTTVALEIQILCQGLYILETDTKTNNLWITQTAVPCGLQTHNTRAQQKRRGDSLDSQVKHGAWLPEHYKKQCVSQISSPKRPMLQTFFTTDHPILIGQSYLRAFYVGMNESLDIN